MSHEFLLTKEFHVTSSICLHLEKIDLDKGIQIPYNDLVLQAFNGMTNYP